MRVCLRDQHDEAEHIARAGFRWTHKQVVAAEHCMFQSLGGQAGAVHRPPSVTCTCRCSALQEQRNRPQNVALGHCLQRSSAAHPFGERHQAGQLGQRALQRLAVRRGAQQGCGTQQVQAAYLRDAGEKDMVQLTPRFCNCFCMSVLKVKHCALFYCSAHIPPMQLAAGPWEGGKEHDG